MHAKRAEVASAPSARAAVIIVLVVPDGPPPSGRLSSRCTLQRMLDRIPIGLRALLQRLFAQAGMGASCASNLAWSAAAPVVALPPAALHCSSACFDGGACRAS